MAGPQLKQTIKGSTLLEVVVSMVIIVTVFGIGIMIYGNVLRLSLPVKKIKAQAVLREMLLQAEQAPAIGDQTIVIEDYFVECAVTAHDGTTNLYDISLTAYDANRLKLAELHQIVAHEDY